MSFIINSIERAQKAISVKVGLPVDETINLVKHIASSIDTSLTYNNWIDTANWCNAYKGNIPYRELAVYIRTIPLRS